MFRLRLHDMRAVADIAAEDKARLNPEQLQVLLLLLHLPHLMMLSPPPPLPLLLLTLPQALEAAVVARAVHLSKTRFAVIFHSNYQVQAEVVKGLKAAEPQDKAAIAAALEQVVLTCDV